jgi:competence protein ComEC
MEKIWLRARALAGAGPRWLVLGHHGSRTSTSEALLTHLSGLKQALASSRMARFGHPHAEVRTACRKHGVALISTEAWGHVILELDR